MKLKLKTGLLATIPTKFIKLFIESGRTEDIIITSNTVTIIGGHGPSVSMYVFIHAKRFLFNKRLI